MQKMVGAITCLPFVFKGQHRTKIFFMNHRSTKIFFISYRNKKIHPPSPQVEWGVVPIFRFAYEPKQSILFHPPPTHPLSLIFGECVEKVKKVFY